MQISGQLFLARYLFFFMEKKSEKKVTSRLEDEVYMTRVRVCVCNASWLYLHGCVYVLYSFSASCVYVCTL